GLTQAMLALKVPVIVTTTTEKMWGPLIPELAEALPGVQGIERTTVNAWHEKRFVDAVKATGRKNLIVTGISTDVCLAFPAIAAQLRSTYGAAARGPARWIVRATRPLPVPVSPRMRIDGGRRAVAARFRMCSSWSRNRRMPALSPMISARVVTRR